MKKKQTGAVDIFKFKPKNKKNSEQEVSFISEDFAYYYYDLGFNNVIVAAWLKGGEVYVKVQYQ